MHDPDVLAAFAVGEKRDPLPVRRKLRLTVEGYASGDHFRLPAFDREGVNISGEFEDNGFAVRPDVQRKPRTFIAGELDFRVGLTGHSFFSAFLSILLLVILSSFLLFPPPPPPLP